jgi:serine/threonine-protein kinase
MFDHWTPPLPETTLVDGATSVAAASPPTAAAGPTETTLAPQPIPEVHQDSGTPPTAAQTTPADGASPEQWQSQPPSSEGSEPSVSLAQEAKPEGPTPRPVAGLAVVLATFVAIVIGLVIVIIVTSQHSSTGSSSDTRTPSPTIRASALPGLLLSPDQIGAVNGATGLKLTRTWQTMPDDSADVPNVDCLAIYYAGEKAVYSGSGWSDVQVQQLEERDNSGFDKYYVAQAVVLFPSASQAAAFFTTSAQQWSNCSNRQRTDTLGGNPVVWDIGPLSKNEGALSITGTQENTTGWACQRALTVANNVAIDIRACSYNPADSAVAMAREIAAHVSKSS